MEGTSASVPLLEEVGDTRVLHPAQLSLFFRPPLGILPRATLRQHFLFLCTLRHWVSFQSYVPCTDVFREMV